MDRNRLIRESLLPAHLPPAVPRLAASVVAAELGRLTPRERPLLGALPATELRHPRARLCLGSRPGQLVTVAVGRRREPRSRGSTRRGRRGAAHPRSSWSTAWQTPIFDDHGAGVLASRARLDLTARHTLSGWSDRQVAFEFCLGSFDLFQCHAGQIGRAHHGLDDGVRRKAHIRTSAGRGLGPSGVPYTRNAGPSPFNEPWPCIRSWSSTRVTRGVRSLRPCM